MRLHKKLGILTISYVFAGYLISGSVPIVNAQTTNITGSRLGTNPVRSGNTINIGGGERAGANLFHSFGQFDLAPGDIANFSPREGANTVISRVTGGAASNIGGTIQALSFSNFYFINPSGIVFGPTAKLNVGGSAYFSTAHRLEFANEGVFNTRSATVDVEVLSSFPVSSFGFVPGVPIATIAVNGTSLSVPSGRTLAVVGGEITVNGGKLNAADGKVQVVSIANTVGNGGWVDAESLQLFNLSPGVIKMNPDQSFAAFDAGPKGVVQTVPDSKSIQKQAGSEIIIQGNLIKVFTPPVISTISSNLTLEEGQTQTITITLNKPAEITETVTLSNSNPGSATTSPSGPTVTFNPGEQTKTIQVTGVKQGKTEITAALRGVARSTGVTVVLPLAFSQSITSTVELGLNGTMTITLNRASPSNTTIGLSSLNGVATVDPTVVTIPAGQLSSAPITVRSLTVGTATIRASLAGTIKDSTMQVTPISIASLSGVSILEGQSGTVTVTLPRVAPSDVAVTLTTSNPNVATVETTVNVPQGRTSTQVTVAGVTEGTAQLRAQSGTSTQTAAVVVNALPPPSLSSLSPNLALKVGGSGSITVVLKEVFKKDLTVLLQSSDPSIASVNESVTIPANSTESQPVVVAGNGAGRTTIIATLLNSSVQALVDVSSVAPPLAQSTSEIGAASQTIGLAAAAQYPRTLAAPQGTVTVPKLLADKCAAVKDGQFSSFAQLNRDSAPPQPGRYLSTPTLLEGDPITGARETVPELSIMVGPPKVLTVHPDVGSFIALAQDCRLEIK